MRHLGYIESATDPRYSDTDRGVESFPNKRDRGKLLGRGSSMPCRLCDKHQALLNIEKHVVNS